MQSLDRARRYMLKRRRSNRGAFYPTQVSGVSSWLRLAASSQSGGEWTPSIVDVLNAGNPVVQTDTDRRAAVGASANGLPTMVFDGSDVHLWPASAGVNVSTTVIGYWIWYKPVSVASVQRLLTVPAAGATMQIYANSQQVYCECYISGANGRFGRTGNVLAAGTWSSIYIQYDSSRGGDANLAMWHNAASQSLTYGNLGAGGTLTTLPATAGNIIIGGFNDSDTPTQPIADGGELGPNLFAFTANLTAAQIAAFHGFERPT